MSRLRILTQLKHSQQQSFLQYFSCFYAQDQVILHALKIMQKAQSHLKLCILDNLNLQKLNKQINKQNYYIIICNLLGHSYQVFFKIQLNLILYFLNSQFYYDTAENNNQSS
ncbi:hypothetical protein TTHERM_000149719 (macronuclear) [Tetrahymena thermophila SB210]|uniref:Uncharacterized protein n=1 Tax=Tetrahymena thermophila (strain SB210) TaxID=312017 RepID=W7X6L1_TETTS|nr:hypothetical protein TTHERM_000149719 [Tetrahymena thermophila SB210]EWS73027.1 hypothetical protein TTHERM_000149719 [Tetrahymena thermophila SB210]|eukprot:XP_012654424.1 hypothetical protein TTHERM_000149719 [Tetrahymena thermophila SB210]